MSRLYELTGSYRQLCELDEADEADVADLLDAIDAEIEVKADNIACVIKELRVAAKAINAEVKVMKERADRMDRRADGLCRYLLDNMMEVGKTKLQTVRNSIAVRSNPESVELHPDFVRWAMSAGREDLLKRAEPTVNKAMVKERLRAGEQLPAQLVKTKRLEVK